MQARNSFGNAKENREVNTVVITTAAINAMIFLYSSYFVPKNEVRNHRIITFSQTVAKSSVVSDNHSISVRSCKFNHHLFYVGQFSSADR